LSGATTEKYRWRMCRFWNWDFRWWAWKNKKLRC